MSSKRMPSKPARSRMSAVASASPSENGSVPGCGGRAASPSAASIACAHSLCSCRCQTSSTRRAPGRRAAAMLAKRGGRIGEEHRPEAADRHVEAGGVEAMHLGVAQLVADVVEPLGRRQLAGPLEHALGHVDAENAARRRRACRLASRQPGSAADVDYLVTGADPIGGAKVLVVSAQLDVVEVQPVRRGHRDWLGCCDGAGGAGSSCRASQALSSVPVAARPRVPGKTPGRR